ncbi:MAG: hypothetical protein K2J12_10050 [Muribaculaceae bacterium]|nr:hypothetical protein [Muribaculaceae bacterium]
MYTSISPDSILKVSMELDSLSNTDEMEARSHYWKAYYHYMSWQPAEARALLIKADSLTTEKYTKERIDGLRMTYGEFKTYETFKKLLEQLKYFASVGDNSQKGNTAMVLSGNLVFTQVPELALYYLNMADSLFNVLGLEERVSNLRINKATLLCNSGRKEEADAVFEEMFADTTITSNKDLYEILLRNHYYFFGDSASLFNGYEIQKNKEREGIESKTLTILYESLIGEYYLNEGKIDAASNYLRFGLPDIDKLSDDDIKACIYQIYAQYYDSIGDGRKAMAAMKSYDAINDSIAVDQNPQNKIYTEYINAKRQVELESEEANRDLRRRLYVTIIASVLLLIVLVITGFRLRRRHQQKVLEATCLAEQREREMMAMALSRQQSDRVLDYVEDEISRLSREDAITAREIAQLDTTLRLHAADRQSLQSFEKAFTNINPDFDASLRAVAPDLSDNQVRLCSYIMLGLNNQEIASLMNVKASSLRQARLRLRLKFGLTKDDSLEAFLRELGKKR